MRFGWLLLVIIAAAGGAVAAVPRPSVHVGFRDAVELLPTDDPFPIRRVRGTDTRLPSLLKELEPGPVVRLPRIDFESRVRAAGRAAAAVKHTPRIVDATYTAELDANELTGTAEFSILNTHDVSGFVPLDPFRLALRSAKWSDGGDAILTVQPGASAPAVWLNKGGRRVLQLGWSLTGTTEPGERRFELRVPPCPASILELTLPADQMPTASSDILLTGPFPVPKQPQRRLWRLRFGGLSKVEFAVRTTGASDSVARATLEADYELTPSQLTATFEYELHPARGSVGEWSFLADHGLRITDVVTNNRAGWTVDPPETPNGRRRIRVSLRQPGPGGKVVISAVAPFPDTTRTGDSLPTIHPLNAVLNDEKLEIRIASSLKVESWNAGDYRLLDSMAAPSFLPGSGDLSRTLSLVGTLLPPNADEPFRRMPSVRVSTADADFTTFERLEWTLGPTRSSLDARVNIRVRHGPLFQLSVRLPQGFILDRGASGPEEQIAHISSAGGAQVVEFARPLLSGQQVELRLEFHKKPGEAAVKPGEAVAFPAFMVNGAMEREGWLSVAAVPGWSLTTRGGAGAEPGSLWGWFTTDSPNHAESLYLFRGKEPEGTATLVRAKPVVFADTLMRLDTVGGEWSATTRFTLNVTGSELPSFVVHVPSSPDGRTWKLLDDTNNITHAIAVPRELFDLAPLPIGAESLAAVVGTRVRDEADTIWVLRFAKPLTGPAVLETTATGGAVSDNAVSLPIPRVLGANQSTRAEAVPTLKDRVEVVVDGESVRVRTRGSLGPPPVSDAYLVTVVRAPNDVLAAFGGTVRGSHMAPLQLKLPPGAEVRGVCVAGRWLNPASCAERDADGALCVPLPAGPAVRFEVRYRLPVEPAWPTRCVVSPAPGVIGGDPLVNRWWAFAAGTLPGWPARPWDATSDELPLLGGPMGGGEPIALVTRSDDEWVRVGTARTADAIAASLAAAIVIFGLAALYRRRAQNAIFLAAIVVVALSVAELGPPWWARSAWPPLVAAVGTLAVVLASLVLRRNAVEAEPIAEAIAASLLVLGGCSLCAVAQPPTPATVLIVTDSEGKEEVIAPRALMERLDAIAKPPLPNAVIASADYDLRADETGAHVVAKLIVHTFRDNDNAVSLPLGDARLERVSVDGKPAFPVSLKPDVYSVALPGPGRHEIELRFAATLTATGSEREIRFGVPEVPRAKLTVSLPSAARQPQIVGRVGRQVIASGDRTTLEADIGAVKTVQLRWREGTAGSVAGAAVVKIREACIWDIKEAGADLTAAYLVRVEQGAVGGLRFDIPRELEVLRVAVRTLDFPAAPLPLRDWALAAEKDNGRLLRVDFQNPATGRLLVVLHCSPRKPITRQPVLHFPHVVFGNVNGETEAVYGLRATRVAIDNVGLTNVIDFPPDAFKDFANVPDLKLDVSNPVRAFRPSAAVAELRPALRVSEPLVTRTLTAWQAGPYRADAACTIAWSAKDPLPMLEFTLGNAKVTELRGADVVSWNQSSGRVQVWFRGAIREGAFEWTGTAVPTPTGKSVPGPLPDLVPFDLPQPRVLNARAASEEVRVRAIDGWSVKVDRARGWQTTSTASGELRFRTETPLSPQIRVLLSIR